MDSNEAILHDDENIFQNKKFVLEEYNKKNYRIEYGDSKNTENYAVIYFSSNGIYYPNTEETFKKTISEKDKYEWRKNKIKRAKKHIFVRDIMKQWYVEGINSEINNVDKLFKFLKNETASYKVITIGSSAGGYAATLFGVLLKAECVFTFAGQYTLYPNISYADPTKNNLLFRHSKDKNFNKYYDISEMIKNSKVPIFYFAPSKSPIDKIQIEIATKLKNVHTFAFKEKEHGVPILLSNLTEVFNMNVQELKNLYLHYDGKEINKILFSIKMSGVIKTSLCLLKKICRQTVKNILRMKK